MPIFAVSFSGEKRTRAPLLKKLTLRAIFSPKVLCAIHQLRLSVAVDAGDPDDLSGPDLEIKVLYRVDLLFIFDIESLNVEDDLTGMRRRRIDDQVNGTSDHFFRQFVL